MKYLITLVLMFTIFVSCSKKDEAVQPCFKIKFINEMCGTAVYQILDANYYNYGQNNWTNPFNGEVLNHVFTLKNHCEILPLATDKTVTVKIIEAPINNCAICLAVYPGTPPSNKIAVKACN